MVDHPTRVTWPHLAPGARFALVVEVDVRARVGDQRVPLRDIAADQIVHADASPRPARCRAAAARRSRGYAARTARSLAPSIVQCPLLWTRGAISLTTGPSAQAKNSTVITPTWPSCPASLVAMPTASARLRVDRRGRRGLRSGAGCRRRECCATPATRATPPSAVARHDHRKFGVEMHRLLGHRRAAADRVPRRGARRRAIRTHAWPLPS